MDNNTGLNNANMDVDNVNAAAAAAGNTAGSRTIRQARRLETRGTRWESRNSISHGSVAGSAGIRPSSGWQRQNLPDPTVISSPPDRPRHHSDPGSDSRQPLFSVAAPIQNLTSTRTSTGTPTPITARAAPFFDSYYGPSPTSPAMDRELFPPSALPGPTHHGTVNRTTVVQQQTPPCLRSVLTAQMHRWMLDVDRRNHSNSMSGLPNESPGRWTTSISES